MWLVLIVCVYSCVCGDGGRGRGGGVCVGGGGTIQRVFCGAKGGSGARQLQGKLA